MSDKRIWALPGFRLDLGGIGPVEADAAEWRRAHAALEARLTGDISFYHYPRASHPDAEAVTTLAAKKRASGVRGVLCIGIGGSHLGGATLVEALQPGAEEDAFPVHWLYNFDPPALERARRFARSRDALCVVISKSGGTLETLAGLFSLADMFSDDRIVAITDPERGELRRIAHERGWDTLPVPSDIGGRFSVLTPVGLFPAALAGIDPKTVLSGAESLREALAALPPEGNPAYQLAWAKYVLDTKRGVSNQYLMPYWSSLRLLSDWYVQLWAESLGKENHGPTPGPALGTRDQHSLLQLFKEGPRNKLIGFVEVTAEGGDAIPRPEYGGSGTGYLYGKPVGAINRLACRATEKSLRQSSVPTYRIEMGAPDGAALGALFLFFELACAFAGELYGVDAFDQPGVEEAKRFLRDALR